MPADNNALVKYAYTRDHSSIYFRKEDGDFDKISVHGNKSASNFAAVKASASPNFVKVAIVVSVVVVGLAVVAGVTSLAVVLSTKDDGVENNKDRQISETTPLSFDGGSTVDSTTESTVGLHVSETTLSTFSGGSTAATTGPSTSATTASVGSTTQSTLPFLSSWGEWTECTVTCGQGYHTRYRSCNKTVSDCDYVQTQVCEETSCPILGRWVTWSQWGNCNTTCGGGIQTRTRSCSKVSSSDVDCVGENLQKRICNDWKCPDCSQKCSVGSLNSDCSACVCNNTTITGRIRSSSTGNAISDAAVYDSAAPTSLLGLSNATGYFILTTKCITSELLITKEGFVNRKAVINGTIIEIEMDILVSPILIQSPQSKVRLTGENVTLCCEAEGNPNITYYEWFKDSVLIKQIQDVNRSEFLLTNLTTDDTGYYQCRANSDVGAVKSFAAELVVREQPSEFCKDALQQKKIVLPDDCVQPNTNTATYEVGQCVAKTCRSNNSVDSEQCIDEAVSCCSAAETRVETVNCTGYALEVVVIHSCGCGLCFSEDLLVSGVVTDSDLDSPISFCKVMVNGKLETYTGFSGQYEFQIDKNAKRFTITIEDESFEYLPTTKVINTENSFGGWLRVDIIMVKAAEPIILDSSQENTLYAGTSSNSSSPRIELKLPANSYYYPNGSAYSGQIRAMFTYLDPTSVSDFESIPGVFQYTNDEGELGYLDTLGVFNLYVEDQSGQRLEVTNAIDAYIPDTSGDLEVYANFKLWTLNAESGIWEDASTSQLLERQVRSKRDTAKLLIGQFKDVSIQKWYNYDKVYKYFTNICYFKICLFEDVSLTSQVSNPTEAIYLYIYIKKGDVLHTIGHYISNPQTYIVNTVCENDQALIIAERYARNGISSLYVTKPSPSSFMNYEIANDAQSLKINLQSSTDGPFHLSSTSTDKSCLQYFYGQKDLEWKYKDVRLLTADQGKCRSNKPPDIYMYWYPLISFNYFKVCFLKVRVTLQPGVTFYSSNKVKIRVFSSVQNKEKTKESVIGIIEREIKLSVSRDITECIEYRCSGPSDPCDPDTKYPTNVKVVIEHSRSDVTFLAVLYPTDLKLLSQTDNSDRFGFIAPYETGSIVGVYSKERGNIDSLLENALKYCLSSDLYSNIVNPTSGLAVTFDGKRS